MNGKMLKCEYIKPEDTDAVYCQAYCTNETARNLPPGLFRNIYDSIMANSMQLKFARALLEMALKEINEHNCEYKYVTSDDKISEITAYLKDKKWTLNGLKKP